VCSLEAGVQPLVDYSIKYFCSMGNVKMLKMEVWNTKMRVDCVGTKIMHFYDVKCTFVCVPTHNIYQEVILF